MALAKTSPGQISRARNRLAQTQSGNPDDSERVYRLKNAPRAEVPIKTLALARRKPDNVLHHSDQGSQYPSIAFGNRCKDGGVRPSTGSVGDAYDNAMCESSFATLECELLDRTRFAAHTPARMEVF